MLHPEAIYIYALKEPLGDKAVRYVGQTASPKKRFFEHLRNNGVNAQKYKWISKLSSDGFIPMMEILETCNKENASEREAYWIRYYLELENDLVNGAVASKIFFSIQGKLPRIRNSSNAGLITHIKKKPVNYYRNGVFVARYDNVYKAWYAMDTDEFNDKDITNRILYPETNTFEHTWELADDSLQEGETNDQS
ncbi:MAG: GIY-YIG nuclease family protein [bacterium]|nr:GIY-YIG nuclease family protein [bacterium]